MAELRPLWLAFDTSGPVGSVAVASGADVLARAVMTSRNEHAARLLPTIEEVLDDAGVHLDELDGMLVGEGPGSFTGVRVAAATAKGLGHGTRLPVRAGSSLAAAACAVETTPIRCALFDARAERVYAACYGVGRDHVEELLPPHASELRGLLASDLPAGAVFVGDGAERHRRVIEGAGFSVAEASATLADGLVALETLGGLRPVPELGAWEPIYLRGSGAERLRKP